MTVPLIIIYIFLDFTIIFDEISSKQLFQQGYIYSSKAWVCQAKPSRYKILSGHLVSVRHLN